ncbi:hypothetical protein A9O66_31740 (plasmid) [Paraburkholderia caribensis]|uniref:Uncharacterized protein n=1 Tax=Paraburkholderia caribensis TaxID=75105 RepID=A0A9Q6WQY3_9BURK|nr:hypothetical protein A9O66_31740 [Paraburkholderia caribensis]
MIRGELAEPLEFQQKATMFGIAPCESKMPGRKADVPLEASIRNFHAMNRTHRKPLRQIPFGNDYQRSTFESQVHLIGTHAGQCNHDGQLAIVFEYFNRRFPYRRPGWLAR